MPRHLDGFELRLIRLGRIVGEAGEFDHVTMQVSEAHLSAEHFARGSETFRGRLKEPGLRAYWMKQRGILAKAAPGYCTYIDGLCNGETTPFQNQIETEQVLEISDGK